MKKEEPDYVGKLLVGIFLILLILGVYAIRTIHQQGTKCIIDPIQYGAEKLAKANNENVIVTVTSGSKTGTYSTDFNFTK